MKLEASPPYKPPAIKRNFVPKTQRTLVSIVAKWFDDIILTRSIKPDLKGRYVFSVNYNELLKNCMVNKITQYMRKIFEDYGYKIKKIQNEVQVTKFR